MARPVAPFGSSHKRSYAPLIMRCYPPVVNPTRATSMSTNTPTLLQPPMRADARRNYERLLATARDVFAEHGPDASLDEIAKRAGVGTLYRHFPTRLALQEAVVRDQNEASRVQAVALLGEPSAGQALATWL